MSKYIWVFIIVFIILITVFAPFISSYDPLKVDMTNRLKPMSSKHILGTDALGRDFFTRLIYGGRSSVLLAILISAVTMIISLIIAMISAYYGGKVDFIIQIFVNIFQAIPSLCFIIAIIGIIGVSLKSVFLSIIITSWAGYSRVIRGAVLKVKSEGYIEGARAIGASDIHIMIHHILPNIFDVAFVIFTTRIAKVILFISSLSFLGVGVPAPIPEWGSMIYDSRNYYLLRPILLIAPTFMITILSLAINSLGDSYRDKKRVREKSIYE